MQIAAPRATLTTEATWQLLRAAIEKAVEHDIQIHVAVMDSSARLVGFLSCDGAPPIAAQTAREKAFTAVQTGMSSQQWKEYVESIPDEERKIIDRIDGYIGADGGFPVHDGKLLLGGIGVSGANQELDAACARAALAAIGIDPV